MPTPHPEHFDSFRDYRAAFTTLLNKARHRIWICDRTLEESGIHNGEIEKRLWEFLSQPSPGQVRILVKDPDFLTKHCPRLMRLREHFSHRMDVRCAQEAPGSWQQGFVLVDEDDYLVRRHFDWPRGEIGVDGRESAILEHIFDQLWEHAVPPSDMHHLCL